MKPVAKLKKDKTAVQFQILLIPALLLYILFVAYPFFSTFYYSITNYNKFHINNFQIIGFKNYLRIFDIKMLGIALKNSIIYALSMTFFQSLIAIPLAVILNRKMKLVNFYRAAFFLPAMFSPLVMGFLWKIMMGPTGIINQFLVSIGMQPFEFLSSQNGLFSIIATQVWQWVGWAVVIYLANLQVISQDLFEASRIDGANGRQIFFKIILPLLYPSVTVVFISSLIGGLKVFDIVQSMTGGGPGYATETIISSMIKIGFHEGNYAMASAFGVVFFIIVMVFTIVLLALLKMWERKVS